MDAQLKMTTKSLRASRREKAGVDADILQASEMRSRDSAGFESDLIVERGPNVLFVKLTPPGGTPPKTPLADRIWLLMRQHFVNQLVLELEEIGKLDDALVTELVRLSEQIAEAGGAFRISGLSHRNRRALEYRHLNGQLPAYRTRAEALFGSWLPTQPR